MLAMLRLLQHAYYTPNAIHIIRPM